MSSGSENNENSSEDTNMESFEEPQSDQNSSEASLDGRIVISNERWQCNFCSGKSRISFVTKKAFLDHVKWYHEFNIDNEEQLNVGDQDQMNHLPTNMETPPKTPSTSKRIMALMVKGDFVIDPERLEAEFIEEIISENKKKSKKRTPKTNVTKRPRILRRKTSKTSTLPLLTIEDLHIMNNLVTVVMDGYETLKQEKLEALHDCERYKQELEQMRNVMESNDADKSMEIENLKQENQDLLSQLDQVQKKFATIQNLIGNK